MDRHDLLPRNVGPALPGHPAPQANLADILERVLDKGIVIAGDIQINLLDIELLTIKLRLLIASADKAKELGIDWWTQDSYLSGSSSRELNGGGGALEERIQRVESELRSLGGAREGAGSGNGETSVEGDGSRR